MNIKCCPVCGNKLDILLFMGILPEFLVCGKCKTAFTIENDKLKPIAKVI